MRRISSFFIFAGILVTVLPFFGLTLRNFNNMSYSESFVSGLIMIAIGVICLLISKTLNKQNNNT